MGGLSLPLSKLVHLTTKMTTFKNIFFLPFTGILICITLSACKDNKEDATKSPGRSKELKAEGFLVVPQTFQHDISASGTLLPNEEVEIHPEVSGRITAIKFTEGSFVKKGQTLLQINDADIIAQVEKLKAQKALQQKMLERQQELLRIGGISQQDYETTQTQIASINADIAYQEAQLRKTRILAPFDGRIGVRDVSVGAIVSPATNVATLQQLHPLKIDFTVPDEYRSSLTPGKAVFFTTAEGDEQFAGKISAIDPGAERNTRAIRVRAVVPNPDGKLTAGSFAHVRITSQSNADALLVPSQAVIPTSREKKMALVKNGKVTLNVVTLGERTKDKVVVLSGVSPGDTVVVTGLMQVKPGMDVKIVKLQE